MFFKKEFETVTRSLSRKMKEKTLQTLGQLSIVTRVVRLFYVINLWIHRWWLMVSFSTTFGGSDFPKFYFYIKKLNTFTINFLIPWQFFDWKIFTSPYFVTPKPHFLGKLIFAIFCFSSAEGKSDLESHHQH